MSFSGKHLPGPPIPRSPPVYLMAGAGCRADTGHSPPQLVVSTRRMEDGGLEGKDHILLTTPHPALHSALEQG